MNRVGIAELKAKLSTYLTAVKNGQEVIVTEHGKPIARIASVRADERLSVVTELEKSGLLRRPRNKLPKDWDVRKQPADPKGAVSALLKVEREHGR